MDAHSIWASNISLYVTCVCIQISMRISSHLPGGKAALILNLHGESRFSTKSWYMHVHAADNKGLISLRGCAVFLVLLYSHMPNVNGAD